MVADIKSSYFNIQHPKDSPAVRGVKNCQIHFRTMPLKYVLLREDLKQIENVDNIVTEEVSWQIKPLWNAPPTDSRYEEVSRVIGQD